MDNKIIAIIVVLILLIFLVSFNTASESFVMPGDLTGVYKLTPLFGSMIKANNAVKLQIIPQTTVNPGYIDMIITYTNGKNKMVRTNFSNSNTYTYYNDISNVLFQVPKNVQYTLHTSSGLFSALTAVITNGKTELKLMDYQITSTM